MRRMKAMKKALLIIIYNTFLVFASYFNFYILFERKNRINNFLSLLALDTSMKLQYACRARFDAVYNSFSFIEWLRQVGAKEFLMPSKHWRDPWYFNIIHLVCVCGWFRVITEQIPVFNAAKNDLKFKEVYTIGKVEFSQKGSLTDSL